MKLTKQIYSNDNLTEREAALAHSFAGLPSKEQLEAELAEIREQSKRAIRKTPKDKLINIFEFQENTYNELVRRKVLFEGRIDILATEVLGYKYEDFHREMSEFQNKGIYEAGNLVRKENRSLIMAPRGGGKSHILTYVQTLYEVLVNPNIRILITSNTQGQSESFLRTLSQHLTDNGTLIKIFGHQKHATLKWDTREINLAGRTRKGRESTIMCIGLGGGVTGLHFDLIIGDDLVDEENARTKHQRDYVFTWFYKTLYPTLEPD